MEVEGWGEKEMFTNGAVDGKNEERGGGEGVKITPPPTLTIHYNSKSNMASQINNCKPVMLACTNKKPALQAKSKGNQILFKLVEGSSELGLS